MRAAAEILARVKISDVARALGIEPHRGRMAAPWRETRDRNVTLSDQKNCWHDFVTGKGGGMVDLVAMVRGGTRADALRWCADLAGIHLADTPLSPADRRRWAEERRGIERDGPTARYWRRTAIVLCAEKLAMLKAALFDPTANAPAPDEIAWWTREHARLSKLDGAALVNVYREAARREPRVTAGLVRWARDRERIEIRALIQYLELDAEAPAA